MNIGMMIFMLASLGIVVAVTAAMPEMSRPTVPLGVSIPSDHVQDPVVRGAIHRFRRWSLIGGLVAAVLTVGTAWMPAMNALVLIAYVAWTMAALARCRRPIQRAKAAEGWYAGVPVRVTAAITPEESERPRWGLLMLALGISLAAIAVVVVRFHALPDPMPTHYNAAGQVDAWASRNWSTALLPGLIGLGSTVILGGVSLAMARRHDAHLPDGKPAAARRLERGNAHALQVALGWTCLLTSLALGSVTVAPVVRLTASGIAWCIWAVVTASMLPIIWLVVDSSRRHRAAMAAAEPQGPESPDDDSLWKWGMFYLNREDPRMWVPKRNGMGFDPNLGHPGGVAFMLGTGLLLLVCVALIVSLQFTR